MKLKKAELEKLWPEVKAVFGFYDFEFGGLKLVLCVKQYEHHYTPLQLAKMSSRMVAALGRPVVFHFDRLDNVSRSRLVGQGVCFVAGSKYAFLPNFFANTAEAGKPAATELSPAAQYVLLYHLQMQSLEGLSAKELAELMTYKYVTLTLALRVLEDLGLCTLEMGEGQSRRLHFPLDGTALYEKALPLLKDPVGRSFYCDAVKGNPSCLVSGINALSRYSMLCDEQMRTIMLSEQQYRRMVRQKEFVGMNKIEGDIKVEVWKYPAIDSGSGVVDRISLSLALAYDHDPRVEQEVERMMEGMVW